MSNHECALHWNYVRFSVGIQVLVWNLASWNWKGKDYEKNGYAYFYEIDDKDLEELCEANDYEFLEDGTVF